MAFERPALDQRVLLLAPTSRDGATTRNLLATTRVECVVCATLELLCAEITRGAAALLVPEEVVLSDEVEQLARCLHTQPVWSDLPVILLARAGAESAAVERAITMLGNVSLVERPMRVSTLVSTVRSALRARERQYQVRDHLDERRGTEERLSRDATLLANVQDSVVVTDLDGVVTFWNEGATRLFGWTADEMLGRPYADRMPEPTRAEVANWIARIAAGEAEFEGEWLDVRKDGSRVWIEATTRRVADVNGRPMHIMGVARDISERKEAEERLRRNHDTFYNLIQNNPFGVYVVDADFRLRQVSLGAQKVFAEVPRPLLGRGFAEVLRSVWAEPFASEAVKLFRHTLDTGEPFVATRTVERRHDTDAVEAYDWRIDRITLPDGRFGVVCYFYDLSERQRLEDQRERLLEAERLARSEAERAGRMKDEFLATLSHELRTPLSAILGWSSMLRRPNAKPESFAFGLETIERNARAQTQIIDDLLDMSRIIAGKVVLNQARIDLCAVVNAAIETVRPASSAKGVDVALSNDGPAHCPFFGDANRLQQVFWNLFSNAIKFTPKGGRVLVSIAYVDSEWLVEVTDSGEGIDPNFLPYVFDRFRQADASTTRRHGGLGLGLSIVKQLVELHGGSVAVHSEGKGQGTTFAVRLPISVLNLPSVENVASSTMAHNGHAAVARALDNSTPPSPSWDAELSAKIAGLKVLVVDDEPDARLLLTQLLEDCGATVIAASSAEEAIARLVEDRPDVLVSDIGMPDQDGYALMRRIRALKTGGGSIPGVALTAYARAEDRVKAVRAGFQMHVPKPVEPAELLTMVASLAGRDGK